MSIRLWLVLQMEHMLNLPPEGQRCSVDHCFVTTDLSHASHGRDGASPHGDKDLIAKLAEEATERGRSTPEQAMSSWQGRLSRLGLELAKVRAFLSAIDLRRIEQLKFVKIQTVGAGFSSFHIQACVGAPQVDSALCDLILQLLCWEPMKRLSTLDALLHPFFDALSPVRYLLQVQHLMPSYYALKQHAALQLLVCMCSLNVVYKAASAMSHMAKQKPFAS